jgi:HlyD family secretion protein
VAVGRLEPEGGVISLGVPLGDRLQRLTVSEGDEVKENQELAYLESYSDRLGETNLIASQLKEAEKRLAAVEASTKLLVKKAKINLDHVRAAEPFDLQAQEAKVRLLTGQFAGAQTDLKRLEGLPLDSLARQQFDHQQLAVLKAKEELAAEQAVLGKIKVSRKSNLELAQVQYESAQADLARVPAEIPVQSLRRSLEAAETRLRHTILRAPTSGRILKIIAHAGESVGAQPVLQMGNTRQMLAVAEVYETAIQHLRLGDRASITSRALPQALSGTVFHIGSMVSKNKLLELDPMANADRRVIEVKFRLDDSASAAHFVNLQVTVTIPPPGGKTP